MPAGIFSCLINKSLTPDPPLLSPPPSPLRNW
jgi:hypothetical protein